MNTEIDVSQIIGTVAAASAGHVPAPVGRARCSVLNAPVAIRVLRTGVRFSSCFAVNDASEVDEVPALGRVGVVGAVA